MKLLSPFHVLAVFTLFACGGDDSTEESPEGSSTTETSSVPLPDKIEIDDPTSRVTRLELVEDESEQVADTLLEFADLLRKREFSAAEEFFAPDFAGHDFKTLPVASTKEEALELTFVEYDCSAPTIVGRSDFMAGVADHIADWSQVETILWKVKAAEFQRGKPHWGKVKLYIHMTGRSTTGGPEAINAWAYAKVDLVRSKWKLSRLKLTSFDRRSRSAPIFTSVASAAGVAYIGTRFGKPGNQSFAFNGAACGDVDGDGDFDLFVPSDGRNFLYLNSPTGFTEVAEERGVSAPDGGTGPVFFDFDRDGDQDLVVGHVDDGFTDGKRIELYRNDGSGSFERVPGGLGLGEKEVVAYSLTVLDYDLDGWLDLFVCGYGITAEEHNNSWIQATNGAPNALFKNVGGESFVDVAEELGIQGHSWSYASAAADFDDDGDADLYVANDYGTNRLWVNEGGKFRDGSEEFGVLDQGNGMGCAFGDLSGDGKLDLYVSNMSSTAGNRILDRYVGEVDEEAWAALKKSAAGNTIFVQDQDGGFTRLPKSAGGVSANWAWSTSLMDFDLDGRNDVLCVNGFVTGDQPFDT